MKRRAKNIYSESYLRKLSREKTSNEISGYILQNSQIVFDKEAEEVCTGSKAEEVCTGGDFQAILSAEEVCTGGDFQLELQDGAASNFNNNDSLTNYSDIVSNSNDGYLSQSNEEMLDTDITDIDEPAETIGQQLRAWSLEHNITLKSTTSLLKILRDKYKDNTLPKDARTLLGTPRHTNIRDLHPGKYVHFGLNRALKSLCDSSQLNSSKDMLEIQVNIDGLPLSKSSKSSFWPILCSLVGENSVAIVGCYYGYEKPQDCNEYLREFVEEWNYLENGFLINNTVKKLKLSALICDAPAKSYVLNIKGHTGFNSCTKCSVEGEYLKNRVCFPNVGELKSDDDFLNQRYQEHHGGVTALSTIQSFRCISNVPFDYMHAICLGVVKKLLILWLKGPLDVRVPGRTLKLINDSIVNSATSSVPSEFVRRPRALSEIAYWKATEFRMFLLYVGPVVLQNKLSPQVYENFICLQVAVTILLRNDCPENLLEYANQLLNHFVSTFMIIYGKHYVSHNVHALLHLTTDVRNHGALDNFSAFKFENFLQGIKKLIRKGDLPLHQLHNRLIEIEGVKQSKARTNTDEQTLFGVHNRGPVPSNTCEKMIQFSMYAMKERNITLTLKEPNNTCLLKNDIYIECTNFIKNLTDGRIYVLGSQFELCGSLFNEPCNSKLLGIITAKQRKELECWSVDDILTKCWKIRRGNDVCALFPIIHSI